MDPEKAEERVKKAGFDPEALEELVHPHLHEQALMDAAHKLGVDADDEEEVVDPGIHNRMYNLVKRDNMAHKGHKIKRSHHTYHHDGSVTHHYEHEDGPSHDIHHATDGGLDGMIDSLHDHMGTPNPGEAEANAGMHGVPEPQASAAGLPPSALPASM